MCVHTLFYLYLFVLLTHQSVLHIHASNKWYCNLYMIFLVYDRVSISLCAFKLVVYFKLALVMCFLPLRLNDFVIIDNYMLMIFFGIIVNDRNQKLHEITTRSCPSIMKFFYFIITFLAAVLTWQMCVKCLPCTFDN